MSQPKLLDQYRERLRVKHYSLRTEEAYLHWVRRFIYFHGKRHPARDNPREDLRARGREMDKDGTCVKAGGREGRRARDAQAV